MTSRQRLAIAAIIGVGAALRLFRAGGELWFDEIVTVEQTVRRPVAEIVSTYEIANQHVMNSLLAHASVAALGESPLAVRLPAIAFGIAAVPALFFAAHELWATETALLSAACLAVSYPHVFYTQSARGYSATVFFTLLATAFLFRLLRRGPRSNPVDGPGYGLATALGLYSLLLFAFVAVGQGAVLLVARRWRALGWLCAGILLAALAYAPMRSDLAVYYTRRTTETGNPLLSPAFFAEIAPFAPALLAIAIGGGMLLFYFARREPLLAALLAAPLAFNVLLPMLHSQGVHPRSFIYALPFAYLVLGEGIDRSLRRSRALGAAFVAIVVGSSLVPLVRYYRLPKQPFLEALDYVAARRRPTETLIGVGLAGKAARFYDPSVPVVETARDLRRQVGGRKSAVWILLTFENELRRADPRLYECLRRGTTPEAVFPAAIGDGAVEVRRWAPAERPGP